MSIWQSVFLGTLQGITEFLPISSSGHLLLASTIFKIPSNLFFDVMLHLGTLLAIIIVYRKLLWEIITLKHKKTLLYLVIASVPTFIIAFVVKFFLPNLLTTKVLPIGFALTIVMIVLSQLLSKEKFGIESARTIPFIVTGIVQGIAVIPGLSRSGSTISVMRLFGLDSKSSANFSFLLSIPVILGSALVETIEVINTPVDIEWYCIFAGVVCAFVSGILAVKAVIKIIAQKNFIWFAVYLIIPLTLSFIIL